MSGEAEGDVGLDGKVMVIRRIRVRYRLRADAAHRETIERIHAVHADACPVARTLKGCVAIETSLELV